MKMKRKLFALFALICAFSALPCFACTSVIISGNRTASGRPIMMKHRDTGELDNRIQWFRGPLYTFIGLVNSPSEGGEVWTGTNAAGFSIMNTASYNIKNDDVPDSMMDREGELMFRALGSCAVLSDFEKLLDRLERPMGVEANFGVIDAQGGAAYYEVNNDSWVKYDVNESPTGYRVVTNFSESGRYEDYMGYERYLTASAVMSALDASFEGGPMDISHEDLFWNLSRSYKHEFTGMDYLKDFNELKDRFGFKGIVVDQDFIPRKSTSASIVIEGTAAGHSPSETVMWTVLGYPACSVAIPLLVADEDIVPDFMKASDNSRNAQMCDLARQLKNEKVFRFSISNGKNYLDLNNVLELLVKVNGIESKYLSEWNRIYGDWTSGRIDFSSFKDAYRSFASSYFDDYSSSFFLFPNK